MAPAKKGPRKPRGKMSPALKKARIKIKSLENEKNKLSRELVEEKIGAVEIIQIAKSAEAELKLRLDTLSADNQKLINELLTIRNELRGVTIQNEALAKDNKELREIINRHEDEIVEQQFDTLMMIRMVRKTLEE